MLDLRDIYQEVIIDHNRAPRNFGQMEDPDRSAEGFNPLCGDRLTLYLHLTQDKHIADICFSGSGCAISIASASLMTEEIKGKSLQEAKKIFTQFHDLIVLDEKNPMPEEVQIGKLTVLMGVKAYPARIKCALLCWHALNAALDGKDNKVSTE